MNSPISALIEQKGAAVHSVSADVSVTEAVHEMNRHRIGSILVTQNGKLTGIFTERDVLQRIVGDGRDPQTTRVSDVMTRNLITIRPEASIEETMTVFAEKRCRHLPVVADGRLVGLISIGDISRWMADSHRTEAEHLKNYIAGGFSA